MKYKIKITEKEKYDALIISWENRAKKNEKIDFKNLKKIFRNLSQKNFNVFGISLCLEKVLEDNERFNISNEKTKEYSRLISILEKKINLGGIDSCIITLRRHKNNSENLTIKHKSGRKNQQNLQGFVCAIIYILEQGSKNLKKSKKQAHLVYNQKAAIYQTIELLKYIGILRGKKGIKKSNSEKNIYSKGHLENLYRSWRKKIKTQIPRLKKIAKKYGLSQLDPFPVSPTI